MHSAHFPKVFPLLLMTAILIVLSSASLANAGITYFISSTGDDSLMGQTQNQPWRTVDRVNLVDFEPGDKILFEGGQIFPGSLSFTAEDGGTSQQPVTVSSYGTGRAVIDAGYSKGIQVYNAGGFSISNIDVKGAGNTLNRAHGIIFYNDLPGGVKLEYVCLDGVDVSGFGEAGVTVGAWHESFSGYRHVRLTNISAHDNGLAGIESWGYWNEKASEYSFENFYIGYCRAYNNSGRRGLSRHSGSGIVLGGVKGGVIERSVAYNNGWLNDYSGGGPVGIWVWDSINMVIQYNESHHNRTLTKDGGGFDLDGGVSDSIMQYNYSHNNDGPGYLLCQFSGGRPFSRNIVRYNISQNDGAKRGTGGLHFWNGGSGISDVWIYNNTFYESNANAGMKTYTVRIDSPMKNIYLANNLFVAGPGSGLLRVVSGQKNVRFQNNCYWSLDGSQQIRWGSYTYAGLDAWRRGEDQESLPDGSLTGMEADPQVSGLGEGPILGDAKLLASLDAYKLTEGSPLIDKGLNVRTLGRADSGHRDFFGESLPQSSAFDIGASEFRSIRVEGEELYGHDFEDGLATDWTPVGGTWKVSKSLGREGWAYVKRDKGSAFSVVGDDTWNNYSVEGYVTASKMIGGVALLGRVRSVNEFYQLELKVDRITGERRWGIWKKQGSSWMLIIGGRFEYFAGERNLLRMEMYGERFSAFVSFNGGKHWEFLGSGRDSSGAWQK